MNNLAIIEKVEKMSSRDRNIRLCQLSVRVESRMAEYEEYFELGIIQGIRLNNGEIDKVRKSNQEQVDKGEYHTTEHHNKHVAMSSIEAYKTEPKEQEQIVDKGEDDSGAHKGYYHVR